MKNFGENLKNERKKAGFTQKELAQNIGVKQQQLSQWERNAVEPTLSHIVALLQALKIDLSDLVDGLDE